MLVTYLILETILFSFWISFLLPMIPGLLVLTFLLGTEISK